MLSVRCPVRLLEALHLRWWAINALFGPTNCLPDENVGEFDPESWALMLRAERCALPLSSTILLEKSHLPAVVVDRVREVVAQELFRNLLVRRQCDEIGSRARHRGWRLIILKGGTSVLDSSPSIDLSDLDLLVHPECLTDVREWFLSTGYREKGGSASHRLPHLIRKGCLPVELHIAIPGLGRGENLWREVGSDKGGTGFHTLPPREHLWHLMLHSVVQHPNRRGRLRELYQIVSALAACSDDDVECVRSRARINRYAQPIVTLLEMSLQARQGGLVVDPFIPVAASSYIWRDSEWARLLPRSIALLAHSGIFLRLGGRVLGRKQWMSHELGFEYSSVAPGVRLVHRISAPAGRTARLIARSLPLWLFAPLAFQIEKKARALCETLDSDE
jgi:hypothetical protein